MPTTPLHTRRTTYKQGQFRLGVVYKPMSAFHPRVFSNVKSLLRSAKQIQVSLDKPVFMTSEPVRVKLSASIPTHQITGVKIHVVQDLQVGVSSVVVAIFVVSRSRGNKLAHARETPVCANDLPPLLAQRTSRCAQGASMSCTLTMRY